MPSIKSICKKTNDIACTQLKEWDTVLTYINANNPTNNQLILNNFIKNRIGNKKGDNSHGWLGPDPVPWVPASQVSEVLC